MPPVDAATPAGEKNSSSETGIEIRSVTVRLGGNLVLDRLDLRLAPRRTAAILGESGCGKSTLLRALLGLVPLDSGEIWMGGARVDASALRRVRHSTGYVVQDGGLFPHLTAGQNAELLPRHLGWSRSACLARAGELADLVRLDRRLLSRYPVQLSGGQRQRIGLIRALMLDPPVLLLDEPLGALDPITREQLQSDLADLFASLRKTVIVVTHDLAEALKLGSEIVLMRAGKVEQQADPAELCERPATGYVARFIRGMPASSSEQP